MDEERHEPENGISETPAQQTESAASLTKEKIIEEAPLQTTAEGKPANFADWYRSMGWNGNPFTFHILPEMYVGYNAQKERILRAIEERQKIILLIGPTGSGKTTMLKWISGLLRGCDIIYIGKPPSRSEEFVDIFSQNYPTNRILRPFITNIKSIYQVPLFLEKKLRGRHLVVMCDEVHEAEQDILEWMRVLGDNVQNMSLVLAGLPVFDDMLSRIETLRKRISARVELLSLTKEDMRKMIEERVRGKGGKGGEFGAVVDSIYESTGGFPREVLRMCDSIVEKAVKTGTTNITTALLEESRQKTPEPSLRVLDTVTQTQRDVLEMLASPKTPGEIADMLDLEKYKSRQHAVRSMNNVLKQLMKDGYVERSKRDRAFVYQLRPQFRSLVIKR